MPAGHAEFGLSRSLGAAGRAADAKRLPAFEAETSGLRIVSSTGAAYFVRRKSRHNKIEQARLNASQLRRKIKCLYDPYVRDFGFIVDLPDDFLIGSLEKAHRTLFARHER